MSSKEKPSKEDIRGQLSDIQKRLFSKKPSSGDTSGATTSASTNSNHRPVLKESNHHPQGKSSLLSGGVGSQNKKDLLISYHHFPKAVTMLLPH